MLDFLPTKIKTAILQSMQTIYEVRIRVGQDLTVKGFDGKDICVKKLNIKLSSENLQNVILALTDYSMFSKEESLKQGIVTSSSGERVGICGEFVISDGKIIGVKNFTSLCIRFPHDIFNCCDNLIKTLSCPESILVVSPPFQGKTTFIRDLGRAYSDVFNANVLFIDEKDELSCGGNFYLGKNSDVIRYSDKLFGFYNGVRAINPDVIVCDELMSELDFKGVDFCINSGVKVVATIHSNNMENLLKKPNISMILRNNTFDKIVFLDKFKIKNIRGDINV